MAVETQQVEIWNLDKEKDRNFKSGEEAYVGVKVFNNNPIPMVNFETRVWIGSSCDSRQLDIEKKCNIPLIVPWGFQWCVTKIGLPDSIGEYGIGGNNEDEEEKVRHCLIVNVVEPPPPGKATIAVKTAPTGAVIYIDKTKIGESPIDKDVAPGKHIVEAKKEGFEKKEKLVTVETRDHKEIRLELTRAKPPRWKKGAVAAVAGMGAGILGGVIKERMSYGEATV